MNGMVDIEHTARRIRDGVAHRRVEDPRRDHVVGVDSGVWHRVSGLPYLVRLGGYGSGRAAGR